MFKAELRKLYLARQRSLSPLERLEKSRLIARNFFQRFSLEKVRILHIFLPIEKNNEIFTAEIYRQIWLNFPCIKTVIPRVNFVINEIENVEFNQDTNLLLNKWQILESPTKELVEPQNIDIVIVPLLAFDKKGFRAGYGKGFYDKLLGKCRTDCIKIGLSYFPPVELISDAKEYDVKLDYCLTPQKIYKF